MDEIKKKWADIQSLTKKKEGERRRSMSKTGGGPAPEFYSKEWVEVVTTRAVYVTLLIECMIFKIALTPLASIAVHVCL